MPREIGPDLLERCLEDLEQRIQPEVEEELFARWRDFAEGRFDGDLFRPRRPEPSPPRVNWPRVSVNQALQDYDAMALQQLAECSRRLESADGLLLCVRCNYGTGILPSLFGAEPFVMPEQADTLPTVRPMGRERVKKLLDAGQPDLNAGWGERVFEMGLYFASIAHVYPKVGRYVHIYHPDLQGPLDVAELLMGSDLFYALVDEPTLVHDLLDLITETYIRFMRRWQRIVPPPDGVSVHWGLLHGGQIMLRDDSAMNLSPEMVAEFVVPYDGRLLKEFGGGAVHFCGRGDHYIHLLAELDGLRAVNLSQPECNDMERIFAHTVDRGINIVGLRADAAEAALARGRSLHGRVHCH